MSTAVADSLTDHSPLDGTDDSINGAEVDANPTALAQILDGTSAVALGGAGSLTITGTYLLPLIIGTIRLWYDTTNSCLRVKHGSAPSSIADGNMLVEG